MIKFSATVTCQYDTVFSPFGASEFDAALQWLVDGGFDAAEICISNYAGVDLIAMKQKLAAHRLGLSTISTGQAYAREGISLIHCDATQRKAAQERICAHVDAAAMLGGKVTIGSIRGMGSSANPEESLDQLAESLRPCIAHAAEKGVTLLLEAINRYETVMLNSAIQARAFLERIGSPANVRVLWDLFHANIEDASMEAAIDTLGDLLQHIHLADSNRYFPGYGHINFEAIYDRLVARGFNGYLSFECRNLPDAQTVRERAPKFIAALRQRG